jgi:hypothetical protein
MRLYNVLFIPNLGVNLVSSAQIALEGFYAIYNNKVYKAIRSSNNQMTFQAKRLNNDRL